MAYAASSTILMDKAQIPIGRMGDGLDMAGQILYMLNGMGIETGIDMDKLLLAGEHICNVLGRVTGSRVARARQG